VNALIAYDLKGAEAKATQGNFGASTTPEDGDVPPPANPHYLQAHKLKDIHSHSQPFKTTHNHSQPLTTIYNQQPYDNNTQTNLASSPPSACCNKSPMWYTNKSSEHLSICMLQQVTLWYTTNPASSYRSMDTCRDLVLIKLLVLAFEVLFHDWHLSQHPDKQVLLVKTVSHGKEETVPNPPAHDLANSYPKSEIHSQPFTTIHNYSQPFTTNHNHSQPTTLR
jgi:hypothetical protein